jgi:hypothetical protein
VPALYLTRPPRNNRAGKDITTTVPAACQDAKWQNDIFFFAKMTMLTLVLSKWQRDTITKNTFDSDDKTIAT